MNKLEKCYYAIIENKKRGKFYGAGPIEVAKKVASKKLKTGKEMEFYLDEVAGKNKRYGPYQATKDKKSGKVAVVKGRKVMKGGLLSISEQDILIRIFNDNCSYLKKPNEQQTPFIKEVYFDDIKIYFVDQSVLIFFKKKDEEQIYTHAIFVDPNRTYVWILKKRLNFVIFINFADFFLNPNNLNESERIYIITNLKSNILSIRINEANIIKPILLAIWSVIVDKNSIGIYSPDYSHPLIKKCVYPDLTFGELNEENPAQRDIQQFEVPKSSNQKFLILTNTGIRGMSFNEPIIYVRDTNILQNQSGGTLTVEEIQKKIILLQNELNRLKTIHQSTYRIYKPPPNIPINPVQTYWQPNKTPNYKKNKELLNSKESIIEQLKQELWQLQQEQLQQLQQEQLQQKQFQKKPDFQQLQQHFLFDYCIFSSGNKLKIMSYKTRVVQDFILMGKTLISIPTQIFKNLMDIPQYFGEFRRIRQISDMRIRQQKPQAFVPQIIPDSRTTREVPQVSYQQKPLTIAMFEKKIADLFNESTIKSYNIKIEILLKNLNPIIDELYRLNTEYQTNQQNPELQVKLRELYQQLGIIFQDTMRESK